MVQIACKDLTLGYEGRAVVSNLSFEVNRGDYLCIVGENGSGKSTLTRTILGLMKPMSGSVSFGDGLKPSGIGYLPQQTLVQRDFPASVKEVVLSGTLNNGKNKLFYRKADKELAAANMEYMNITDLAKRCYRELSGGQQQRVLLARALCATGNLLFLDEPTAGLDPVACTEMYEIIRNLNREKKITIIMVTHDMSAAFANASHILHIGEHLFYGSLEEYKKTPMGQLFLSMN